MDNRFRWQDQDRVQSQPVSSNSASSHLYPAWFEKSRQHFATEFDPQGISRAAGDVLREPIFDAIGVGRRIRPALFCAFWAAETGKLPKSTELSLAIAIELFHAASIIVDDLADQEVARRDKLPLFRKYGDEMAFLSSHALVANGYAQLSQSPYPLAIITLWNGAYLEACLGQSLDYRMSRCDCLHDQQEMSLKKTTAFFSFIGSALDLLFGKNAFKPSFRAMGRVFQIGNDVLDLLCMDTTPRMIDGGTYPLRLSFLVPRLVKMGLIDRKEIFATHPVERLREIAVCAQRSLPSADEILRHEIQMSLQQIKKLPLNDTQKIYCEDFIRQSCTQSFWNHEHERVA
jgi:Polyprenyl synthetase